MRNYNCEKIRNYGGFNVQHLTLLILFIIDLLTLKDFRMQLLVQIRTDFNNCARSVL